MRDFRKHIQLFVLAASPSAPGLAWPATAPEAVAPGLMLGVRSTILPDAVLRILLGIKMLSVVFNH